MLKKSVMILFGLLASGILFAAENLIPNPDFASANKVYPNGWYAHQATPRALENFSVEDGVARISQKSPSNINQLILSIPVKDAKKLTLKIDYKLDMLKREGGMLYHFTDKSGKRMHESCFVLATKKECADWKTFSTTVAVPEGADKLTITLAVYGAADYPEASFYFRNPVVEEVDAENQAPNPDLASAKKVDAENLMPNPDFASANKVYPNGWYAHQVTPRALQNFSVEDGVASISQKSPSNINQLILSIPVKDAKKLTLKIDYKLDMLKREGGMLYHFTDKSGKRMHESRFVLATKKECADWKTFSTTVAVPAGADKLTITLAVYGAADDPEASFYFRNPAVEKEE